MKIALIGYGKMGRLIRQKIEEKQGLEWAGGVDPVNPDGEEGIYGDLSDLEEGYDVVIDFSHPANLDMICRCAEKRGFALVMATTGHSDEQILKIKALGEKMPVVYTANCSTGVTVLQQILRQIAPVLKDTFDIEVIEKHHNLKLDSPSGTAKMLVEAIDPDHEFERQHGREGNKRRGREIGVHAVRGGTIVGEHTVIFAGEDEIIEITHQANSKLIFANGAVRAAQFAAVQKPGLYSMNDVLFG